MSFPARDVVVHEVARAAAPAALKTRIFGPLGMRDTGFWAADTQRLATAYQPAPDGLVVLDEPDGRWSRPPRFDDGGGRAGVHR